MKRNPLYLVLSPVPNDFEDGYILQLRTNIERLESYRVVIEGGDVVVKAPKPIIEIARGRREELYGLANKQFNARRGAWTYLGDYTESYQIQGEGHVLQPLTKCEASIVECLREKPYQIIDDLCRFLNQEKNVVGSALRYLHENGYVVMESPEQRYTVRYREETS